MTKQELMETYTRERLAEMVVNLENYIKIKVTRCELSENGEILKGKCDKCGEEFIAFLDEKYILCKKTEFFGTQDANKQLNKDVEKLQSEVEKYRKAFESTKKERDCQIAEYQKKIEELTEENNKLKGDVDGMNYHKKQDKNNNFYDIYAHSAKNLTKDDLLMFLGILTKELTKNGIDFRYEMEKELKVWDIKIKSDKEITDFLPTEPIKVADMLINASKKRINCMTGKEYDKYIFEKWQLRQISEHLLVYCNHNGEDN